ncbi:hypothetical protein P692DRAFT_20573748 [Suillus brevipes Sb2]|nr:hypothetical protein P692DRAFT_20573748 [Suillus brevipes Sb2]
MTIGIASICRGVHGGPRNIGQSKHSVWILPSLDRSVSSYPPVRSFSKTSWLAIHSFILSHSRRRLEYTLSTWSANTHSTVITAHPHTSTPLGHHHSSHLNSRASRFRGC